MSSIPYRLDQPLEIPPPTRAHPLRFRRVLTLMRQMKDPDTQVEAGLEFFDAVGGLGGEATFNRFVNAPEGRRLLRTRPNLVEVLGDRDALAAMPEGSLGRAYLDFAERNGFAADGLVEKNNNTVRERSPLDPYRQWFWDRFTVAHDLWHVMAGCPTTADGEVRLLAFSYAQTPQRGYFFLLLIAGLSRWSQPREHWKQFRAWRTGRRAGDLVTARWEEFLSWPLEEVRRCYGVEVLDA